MELTPVGGTSNDVVVYKFGKNVFKTLRARITLLLIVANLPVIALAVWIGVRDFQAADLVERDRLVQAAELLAARAAEVPTDPAAVSEDARKLLMRDSGSRAMIAAAVVTPDGRALAEDQVAPFGRTWLPKDGLPNQPLVGDLRIVKGRGADGRAYRYALAPTESGSAIAVAAAPFDFLGRSQTQWLLLALGLPALMGLLCIGLVLFGIERFVLRWIRMLRATAAAYDGGRMASGTTRLDGAPLELTELGETLDAMSQRIEERSVALESAVDERDRLLRELHHRVKNNFQMIASLLALQRGEAPETLRDVLRAPEDRVRAMASAYKASYATGAIGHVEVGELVRDVARQARQGHLSGGFDVDVRSPADAGEIDLDRAVSLALLVMEILSAASTVAEALIVTVRPAGDGKATLNFRGRPPGWLPLTGLPHRLIGAYVDQLSSRIVEFDDGSIELEVALASDKPSIGMKAPRRASA